MQKGSSAPTATDPRFRASQAAPRALAQAALQQPKPRGSRIPDSFSKQSKRPNRAASESKRRGRLLEAFSEKPVKERPVGVPRPEGPVPRRDKHPSKKHRTASTVFFDALHPGDPRAPQPARQDGHAPVVPGTRRSPAVADRTANPILTAPPPSSPPRTFFLRARKKPGGGGQGAEDAGGAAAWRAAPERPPFDTLFVGRERAAGQLCFPSPRGRAILGARFGGIPRWAPRTRIRIWRRKRTSGWSVSR